MHLNWTWSTPTSRFPVKSTEAIIEICHAAGLEGLEGGEHSYAGHTEAELQATATAFKSSGIGMETFHLPFSDTDDIASFYETSRRNTVRKLRFWMERASLLGASIGILHPSTNRFSVKTEGLDRYLYAMERSLNELLPAAEALHFVLALENMLPGEGERLGSQPEHFVLFRQKFGHPNLKFCLDTGHALVALRKRFSEFFPAMGHDLAAFHLQDNAGDRDSHLAPGHGLTDWGVVFRGMTDLNFRGLACIEAVPFDFGPNYSTEAWRRMVDNTRTLALQALQDTP